MVHPSLFSPSLPLFFFLKPGSDEGKFTLQYRQPPLSSLPHAPPMLLIRAAPPNDRRHLALWT